MGSVINSPGVGSLEANGVKIPNGNIEFASADGSIIFTVDPVTKKIDMSAVGTGSASYKPYMHTLTPTDIANKFLTLPEIPLQPSKTRLIVIQGIEQAIGDDFTVSGAVVSWNGLPMESLLSSGDKLIIIYL